MVSNGFYLLIDKIETFSKGWPSPLCGHPGCWVDRWWITTTDLLKPYKFWFSLKDFEPSATILWLHIEKLMFLCWLATSCQKLSLFLYLVEPSSSPIWLSWQFRGIPGLPMHSLPVFDALEPKFTPLSLSCAWNWPSKLASGGCVYFLKFCTVHQPEKVEGFPLVRLWYHLCDHFGKCAMLSA